MKKKLSILGKTGYILGVLSIAFLIASGVMLYGYYTDDAQGRVAPEVKAASGQSWTETWTSTKASTEDKIEVNMPLDKQAYLDYARLSRIFKNCPDGTFGNESCGEYIAKTKARKETGGWQAITKMVSTPPVVGTWTVNLSIADRSYRETWAPRYQCAKTFIASDTDGRSHSGILFTGAARVTSANRLEFETYRGSEHQNGGNDYLDDHSWVKFGYVPTRYGNVQYTDPRLNAALTGTKASHGAWTDIASSCVPVSWTATGHLVN